MTRKLCGIALSLALAVTSSTAAFAASDAPSTNHAALAPGKPAGVKAAALRAPLWVWVAGIGFVALGVGLVASGNGSSSTTSTSSTNL